MRVQNTWNLFQKFQHHCHKCDCIQLVVRQAEWLMTQLPELTELQSMQEYGVDSETAHAEKIITCCKDYRDSLHPYSSGGAYLNFIMDEAQEQNQASYKHN